MPSAYTHTPMLNVSSPGLTPNYYPKVIDKKPLLPNDLKHTRDPTGHLILNGNYNNSTYIQIKPISHILNEPNSGY